MKRPRWLSALLHRLRESSGASEESESEFDGAFSYTTEYHAFFVGVAVGFAAVFPSPGLKEFVWTVVGLDGEKSKSEAIAEAKAESWYALGGVAAGALLAVVCLATLLFAAAVASERVLPATAGPLRP